MQPKGLYPAPVFQITSTCPISSWDTPHSKKLASVQPVCFNTGNYFFRNRSPALNGALDCCTISRLFVNYCFLDSPYYYSMSWIHYRWITDQLFCILLYLSCTDLSTSKIWSAVLHKDQLSSALINLTLYLSAGSELDLLFLNFDQNVPNEVTFWHSWASASRKLTPASAFQHP
jgi:hypothetical protein